MGGPSGSSGTPSNSSGQAVAYQPTAQPQSDALYQALLGGFAGSLSPNFANQFSNAFGISPTQNPFSSTPGGVSYNLASPFVGGAGTGTITDPNSPFYQQASAGAQSAASTSPQVSLLGQFLANNALPAEYGAAGYGTGNLTNALTPTNLANTLSQFQQGQGAQSSLNNAANQLGDLANNYALTNYPTATNAGNYLTGLGTQMLQQGLPGAFAGQSALNTGGNSILNTAFDPQQALYNQLQNQTTQQAEAAAAAAGLGGSAYGASTVGNTLNNFNINWQNQQLARQAQGLSSAQGAYGTAAGLPGAVASPAETAFSTGLSLPASVLQAGTNIQSALPGIYQNAQNLTENPLAQGMNIQSGLNTLGFQPSSNLLSQTSQIPGLESGAATLAGTPYNTQSTGTNNALSALTNYSNLGNQQFAIPQQLANDLQSYLQLGQAASGLSGQLGALGQQELGSSLSGIGSALGTGSNLLFGNQGLSGALGLGSSGLLGSLGGGGAAAGIGGGIAGTGALDVGGGGELASGLATSATGAADAAGGGFSLGSLLPFGAAGS